MEKTHSASRECREYGTSKMPFNDGSIRRNAALYDIGETTVATPAVGSGITAISFRHFSQMPLDCLYCRMTFRHSPAYLSGGNHGAITDDFIVRERGGCTFAKKK